MKQRIYIHRINSGPLLMKRYKFPNGTILVTTPYSKRCNVIPASCPHVSVPVDRSTAAKQLASLRRGDWPEGAAS